MRTIRRGLVTGVVAMAALGWWSGSAMAFVFPGPPGPSRAQRCEAAKNLAAGAKALCVASEYAKAAKGQTPDFARCEAAFTKAFARAEKVAGPGVCPTEGDTAAIESLVDACMADVASALAGNPPPPCTQFPATGQTTCWNSAGTVIACAGTGQDGDIKAGAALSYTDNGDGTITDNNTGLMWEKKSDDGSIHDKDTLYTWANAFAVYIAGLNAGAGFAGHTDWRVPNVKELQSIMNYENFNPAVSPAFNTGCVAACTVLTCSCTAARGYWSSSTVAIPPLGPSDAWLVVFFDGSMIANFKGNERRVRAVRSGL
jgi:hypothetical protein